MSFAPRFVIVRVVLAHVTITNTVSCDYEITIALRRSSFYRRLHIYSTHSLKTQVYILHSTGYVRLHLYNDRDTWLRYQHSLYPSSFIWARRLRRPRLQLLQLLQPEPRNTHSTFPLPVGLALWEWKVAKGGWMGQWIVWGTIRTLCEESPSSRSKQPQLWTQS